MRGLLVVVFALAACDDAIGIEVIPDPMTPASKVELFIGFGDPCTLDVDHDGEPDPCPGIGPPEGTATTRTLAGEVFFADNPVPFVSSVDGSGSAWFRLEPSDIELPVIVAVGYGDNGPNSVAILKELPLDVSPVHVRVQLEAAVTKLGSESPSVLMWPEAAPDRSLDLPTCVGAEVDDRRVFIVPPDDPDCDAVTADAECDPFVHLAKVGKRDVGIDEVTCTFPNAVDGNDVCGVGAGVCDESTDDRAGCDNARDICVGTKFCAECPDLDPECLNVVTDPSAARQVATIECKVFFIPEGNPGLLQPCAIESNVRANPALVDPSATDVCTAAAISLRGSPNSGPFGQFMPQLTIDTNVDLGISMSIAAPCQLGVRITGSIPANSLPSSITAWTQLETPNRTLVLPMNIKFESVAGGMCPGESNICGFAGTGSDALLKCL